MNPFTNKWGLLVVALTIIAFAGVVLLLSIPAPKSTLPAGIPDVITFTDITASTTGTRVAGQARGTWYFEASFPVKILDASGATIAQGPAQAQSDWMTTDFVPFVASLSYPTQPKGSHGTILIKNDNPSGDPARDQSVSIPVVFN